jgi:hypothetical protein
MHRNLLPSNNFKFVIQINIVIAARGRIITNMMNQVFEPNKDKKRVINLAKYNLNAEVKEDEIGRAYSTNRE